MCWPVTWPELLDTAERLEAGLWVSELWPPLISPFLAVSGVSSRSLKLSTLPWRGVWTMSATVPIPPSPSWTLEWELPLDKVSNWKPSRSLSRL